MQKNNILDNCNNAYTFIDTCTIEDITKNRKKAIDCLMDNFAMYNNIICNADINVDRINISCIDNKTYIRFNANKLINYIYKYYGLPMYNKFNPTEFLDEINKKIIMLENVKYVSELNNISEEVYKRFVCNLIGKFKNTNHELYKEFVDYIYYNADIERDSLRIITSELNHFIEKEALRMHYLSIQMVDDFIDLTSVPNHYLSGISDFDLKLIISNNLLHYINRNNYESIYNYVKTFIKDNIEQYALKYELNTVVKEDNEIVSKTYSFVKLVNDFENIFDCEINKFKVRAKSINELPKLKEQLDKLMEDNKIEKVNYEIFTEIDKNLFEEDLRKVTRSTSINLPNDYSVNGKEKFEEKIKTYGSLNEECEKICIGVDTFDGYFGFVFKNGVVVLDKFFKNKNENSVSFGDAAYIIKQEDFEKVSSMSRRETIKYMYDGLLDGDRVYHTEDWDNVIADVAKLQDISNIHEYIKNRKEHYKKERTGKKV